jgi:hypothetical protein
MHEQVEKHWTEKSRDEMTERDWRIFREDFSISYKGTNTVLPLRNWDELEVPKEIRKVSSGVGGWRVGCIFTRTAALCFSLAGGPKQIRKVSSGIGG